jgi:hypothetical protein
MGGTPAHRNVRLLILRLAQVGEQLIKGRQPVWRNDRSWVEPKTAEFASSVREICPGVGEVDAEASTGVDVPAAAALTVAMLPTASWEVVGTSFERKASRPVETVLRL